jgi:hypothetical protein
MYTHVSRMCTYGVHKCNRCVCKIRCMRAEKPPGIGLYSGVNVPSYCSPYPCLIMIQRVQIRQSIRHRPGNSRRILLDALLVRLSVRTAFIRDGDEDCPCRSI